MTSASPRRLRTFARTMRSEPTRAEKVVWRLLRAKRLGGLKFKRQAPIGAYIVDFVSFQHRVVVELDGGQHADSDYDQARDRWLAAQGFRVLRIWNLQVDENAEGVADMIAEACGISRG